MALKLKYGEDIVFAVLKFTQNPTITIVMLVLPY